MPYCKTLFRVSVGLSSLAISLYCAPAEEPPAPSMKFWIDGSEPGFRTLGKADFVNVNCNTDTWTWAEGGVHCTGRPIGVTRSQKQYTNFELVAQWRHLRSAGNSGFFIWASEASLI